MNSRTTGIWLVIAAALFAFIFIFQRHFHPPAAETAGLLPGLQPAEVTNVQISPAGVLEIRADRAGKSWMLTKPLSYPAQPAAIEALLGALQKLSPARISAAELREHPHADADFGFNPPRANLVIQSATQRWQLQVGSKTPPGDQVYLHVIGEEGAFVADADWLKFIPLSANDWRNTALVDASSSFDSIVMTNGTKVIELHRDSTNQLWRMTRPTAARADSARITELLQRLQTAQVAQFVTDDTKADLSAYGLQPPDLSLWLGRGTNFTAIHTGKTNEAAQIYARREGWNTVVTTDKEVFTPWRGQVKDFYDPYLVDLTAPVAEIEVHGEKNFILQRQGTNGWAIAGEKFPVDTESAQTFLKLVAGLRTVEFVKDVATAQDRQSFGLEAPVRQIIVRSKAGDTNSVMAALSFGTNQDNKIFVRRADEDFVYAIALPDFNTLAALYGEAWEFRDRQIWNFNVTNVAQITLHQDGKTRQLVRTGDSKWSLAPGSQGAIEGKYIEQAAQQLSQLTAYLWAGRNVTDLDQSGFNSKNLQITVELKSGEKLSTHFGNETPRLQSALAETTLDGERWVYVFPPGPYLFVLSYLTIPANVP
jgi:hypothetical protein